MLVDTPNESFHLRDNESLCCYRTRLSDAQTNSPTNVPQISMDGNLVDQKRTENHSLLAGLVGRDHSLNDCNSVQRLQRMRATYQKLVLDLKIYVLWTFSKLIIRLFCFFFRFVPPSNNHQQFDSFFFSLRIQLCILDFFSALFRATVEFEI